MKVPSLKELCAKKMLDDPSVDVDTKVLVLDKLKELSKARAKALEEEVDSWNHPDYQGKSRSGSTPHRGRKSNAPQQDSKVSERDAEARAIEQEIEREEALKYKMASEAAKARRSQLKQVFEWKQRFTQLAHRAQVLDRERLAILRMAKGDLSEELTQVERHETEIERGLQIEDGELKNALDKAKWAVTRFKATVAEPGAGETYLATVQRQLEHAENLIASTKLSQCGVFEELIEREEKLSLHVEEMKAKFDAEEQQDKASKHKEHCSSPLHSAQVPHKRSASVRSPISSRLPKGEVSDRSNSLSAQIERIDNEIADLGGHNGGWDSRDQSTFLRIVSRLKLSDAQLVHFAQQQDGVEGGCTSPGAMVEKLGSKVALEVPAMDDDMIDAHIRWYGRYLYLLTQKKNLVKEWKSTKRRQNSVHLRAAQAEEQEQVDPNTVTRGKMSKEDQRRSREAEAQRRQAVQEWRAAKQREKLREEEIRQATERAEREERAKRALLRRKEKEQIALFKLEREAAKNRREQIRKSVEIDHRESQRVPESMSLKERQQRSLEAANARREALREKQQAQQARAERIANLRAKPAVRPEFKEKLEKRGMAELAGATAGFKAKALTPEELGHIQELRAISRAHDTAVPSVSATLSGTKGYGIGVQNLVSGRAAASWRTSR